MNLKCQISLRCKRNLATLHYKYYDTTSRTRPTFLSSATLRKQPNNDENTRYKLQTNCMVYITIINLHYTHILRYILTGSGTQPGSYLMGTVESFLQDKTLGNETDYSPLSNVGARNAGRHTSTLTYVFRHN
jgi:hypothetical protein